MSADAARYRDLREWIAAARGLGEIRDVRGATWQEDIGRITEMLHHTDDSPAVLFDEIPDTRRGTASWPTPTPPGAASRSLSVCRSTSSVAR